MPTRRSLVLLLSLSTSLALFGACSDSEPTPLAPSDPAADLGDGATRISVLSRNLYVGADVDRVIAALASPDPTDDFPALAAAVATLGETDFPTRARAFADEIARTRPHVVGLQEVSTIDLDLAGLGLPVLLHQDFLPILLAALTARGLDYRAVGSVTNVQAAPLPGVSLTDRDVLLIDRSRVTVIGTPIAANYATNIGVVAPGVNLVRGYIVAEVRVGEKRVTVATTHLESGSGPSLELLRAAQMTELTSRLGDGPVIVLGDLNDRPGSPMYQVLAGNRFVDLWTAFRGEGQGFSCCEAPNLGNERPTLDQRIDYVWARGQRRVEGEIALIGNRPLDRVAGPAHLIWPSDHAGLVARVAFLPSLASR